MEIVKQEEDEQTFKLVVDTDEEALFYLLKTYLESMKEVDIVGVVKEHHLLNETEFYLKVKSGSAKKVFKKALSNVKKDLVKFKIK